MKLLVDEALQNAEDPVLVTTDTDFGTILALTGAAGPNVLLLRGVGDSVTERVAAILDVLPREARKNPRSGRLCRSPDAVEPRIVFVGLSVERAACRSPRSPRCERSDSSVQALEVPLRLEMAPRLRLGEAVHNQRLDSRSLRSGLILPMLLLLLQMTVSAAGGSAGRRPLRYPLHAS